MKQPHIVGSEERGRTSSRLVWNLFLNRPWVLNVRETIQNSKEDVQGHDMFVWVVSDFRSYFKLCGDEDFFSVQIKSSARSLKSFVHKYSKENRFFNISEKSHQFVLCGMDESELVLADIVGQLVVHASVFGINETKVLKYLRIMGDDEAISAYKHKKVLLMFSWYGSRLPSSH